MTSRHDNRHAFRQAIKGDARQICVDQRMRMWDNRGMEMNNMADESMTRPMTPAQQAQMLDEEADFYVRYNGAKSDEHRWVQSLRAGAVSLRQSVADAQAMSNLLAAPAHAADAAATAAGLVVAAAGVVAMAAAAYAAGCY
jgi:hypothetical protein